ncbi:MAG: hypothetical protein AAFU64_03530 [Bacteroidota bacterium]
MKDDQWLDGFFEKARKEPPKLSYEEVSKSFLASSSIWYLGKFHLLKYLNGLNITLLTGSVLLSVWLFAPLGKEAPQEIAGSEQRRVVSPPPALSSPKKMEKEAILSPGRDHQAKDSLSPLPQKENPKGEKIEPDVTLGEPDTLPRPLDLRLEQLKQQPSSLEQEMPPRAIPNISAPNFRFEKPEKKVKIIPQTQQLILRKNDSPEMVKSFLNVLQASGLLNPDKPSGVKHKDGVINHCCLWFHHAQGLDFKLSGTGFEQLEIELQVDQQGNVQHFRYRFNAEAFTWDIPLNCQGFKDYAFGEGFQGKSGRTNVRIE